MQTRQKSQKQSSDANILQKFLSQNPNVQLSSRPSVQIQKIAPHSVARKKFLLKHPNVQLKMPSVHAKPLGPSALKSLQKLAQHIDDEKTLIREKKLNEMYYDASHPAGYGSTALLYKHAKRKVPGLKYKQVDDWLQKQSAHYLSKKVRKFQRRPVLVRGVQHQYQADLMDFKALANYNHRRRYILTVIDCFSRKAAAVPLRFKSAEPVQKALEKAFERLGYPKKLQTDQGSEFFNKEVKDFLRRHNVAHFFTHQELKAQMVERFNRTLRDKIAKYIFAHNSWTFMHVLPDFIDSYNNKVHSSLKRFTPNQVNKSNEDKVRSILYKDYFAKKKDLHKYKIGDKVRPIIKRAAHKKMAKTFHKSIYTVTDVLDTFPPTYHLMNPNNVAVEGAFYEKQLQPV